MRRDDRASNQLAVNLFYVYAANMAPTATMPGLEERGLAAYRDERSTAEYLGISVETLRGWRKQNCGPRYRKIGKKLVRYAIEDVRAFIEAQPSGGGQAA